MKKYRTLVAIVFIAVVSLGYYAFANTDAFTWLSHDKQTTAHDEHMDHSDDMMASSTNGISERQFIEHMIPHHQEAIDTATVVLARGEHTEVKALAEGIIRSQEKEVADMKIWYKNWYGTEYKDNGSYKPMMRDLSGLSGKALDKAFVEDMIPHHMHALMMNQQVVPNIEHVEIKNLATAIAETQSNEIVTMRILLPQL
jgi:uncharacterized protein (DUF305 family)